MARHAIIVVVLLFVLLAAVLAAGVASASPGKHVLVRVWLEDVDHGLTELAEAPLVPLAIESLPAPHVLALADESGLAWLAASAYAVDILDSGAHEAFYCMAEASEPWPGQPRLGQEVVRNEHYVLLRLSAEEALTGCTGMARLLQGPIRLLARPAAIPDDEIAPIPQVRDVISQVYLSRMLSYVDELSGEQPAVVNGVPYTISTRYTYAVVPLGQAVDYMVERLQRLGLEVTTHTWQVGTPPNIIAEKPGLDPAAGIFLITAHLDSTSSSPYIRAPGADDNASGSVAVLKAAELLSAYNFEATLRFVLFTGEEQGLLGSRAYAQQVSNQDIRGVLNLDMIAWDSIDGPDTDLHARQTLPGSLAMAQLFADVAEAYELDLLPAIYPNGLTASDHSPFWDEGISAILVIENYLADPGAPRDFNAYYHSPNDRSIHFNQAYFVEMVRASLATMAHLASLNTTCYWADLNCDCQVRVQDIQSASARWGAVAGEWNYHVVYDVHVDGQIDALDIQQFADEWGWTCGP